ncbi:MAG: AAA family ATPase [Desulfitobacterium hafniense]|nr:AAA family ATPase [Desulfitobacterium hafniense]
MRIFLCGVSCVGKTTVGRLLAEQIGYKFIDLDYEVEAYYNKPIEFLQKEYFTMEAYRKKVLEVLKDVLQKHHDNYVLALPPSGLRESFRKVINTVDPVIIVLTDRAKNILERISFYDEYSRPMEKRELSEREKENYLREIRLDMEYFGRSYGKVDYRINIAGAKADVVVNKIRGTLRI